MGHNISMRELQKMSAGAIQSLSRAVQITSNGETVATLIPARPNPSDREARRRSLDALVARLDESARRRTPDEQAWIDALFAERGIVDT